MGVDVSIQYNGYNSYKFNENDFLVCYPFGVENMSHITHSFASYSPSALESGVRAKTDFIDSSNNIIHTVTHSFSLVAGLFEKKEITVAVTLGAKRAQLTFLNEVSSPWWVATPKTEEGEIATPYAANLYGQMTYISPNGVYTGMVQANQVILADNSGLSDRLTKINPYGVYTGEVVAEQVKSGMLKSANGRSYIDLDNNRFVSDNVDFTGKVTATSGSFTGTISSTNGSIGSWKIGSYGLYNDSIKAGFMTHPESGVSLFIGGLTYQQIIDDYDWDEPYLWLGKDGNVVATDGMFRKRSGSYGGGHVYVEGNFTVDGTKNRAVSTQSYGKVLLNAYETPRPTFADTGHAQIGDDGLCYIDIDLIFLETIDHTHDYRYFLTKYGKGDLWVKESYVDYFVIEGTPNLEFDWKIEAVQKDYNIYNLEKFKGEGYRLEEIDYVTSADNYLREYKEEILYEKSNKFYKS